MELQQTAVGLHGSRPAIALTIAANYRSYAMSIQDDLAERVRRLLRRRHEFHKKKMFGGLAFLLNGNMCCGVHKGELIVRLAPGDTDKCLSLPHTRVFDLSGRPMQGWILVAPSGLVDDKALARWVKIAVDYATSLPPK